MKTLISASIAALLFSTGTLAAPNIDHDSPNGSDRIRTADGASCEQAVATGKNFVLGVYGDDGYYDSNSWDNNPSYNNNNNGEVGVYAGISIEFGGEKRIDCSRLYDNEMERRAIELDMMKTQHEQEKVLLQQEIDRLKRRGNLNFTE